MNEEFETIDLSKVEPIFKPDPTHIHAFEQEPDPDYPDRVYLTCKCGFGTIVNKK